MEDEINEKQDESKAFSQFEGDDEDRVGEEFNPITMSGQAEEEIMKLTLIPVINRIEGPIFEVEDEAESCISRPQLQCNR